MSVMYWDGDPNGHNVLKGPATVVRAGSSSVVLRLNSAMFKVPRGDIELPKPKLRRIVDVFLDKSKAEECVATYQRLGRNPVLHERSLRAEWLGASCFIVVADLKDEKPKVTPLAYNQDGTPIVPLDAETKVMAERYRSVRGLEVIFGCWSDLDEATGVPAKKALAVWGVKTLNGTKQVRFDEIDYYRIFPADTRMGWDGSEGREMFRDAEGR
jgi:hypothetical protein